MKKYVRWFILGLCITFLATTLHRNWQNLGDISFHPHSGALLLAGLITTLLAHINAGAIWWYVVKLFNQPLLLRQAIAIYLKTNLAKYLPGNIWHFYGRVDAIRKTGAELSLATMIVLIEPLLMAIAAATTGAIALSWGLLQRQGGWGSLGRLMQLDPSHSWYGLIGAIAILGSLITIHPQVLSTLLRLAGKLKHTKTNSPNVDQSSTTSIVINAYPLVPLMADVVYILMRGLGFIFVIMAVSSTLSITDHWPMLIAGYSFAWVLGLIVPGAPGGLGVFEATIMILLGTTINPALLISTIAIFRIVNTIAELLGAGIGVAIEELAPSRDGSSRKLP
jgi:uncharacterized membrane protein YbhN (UPF0104 family)